MALDFPLNPSTNDTYTLGDKTWIYNGYGWEIQLQTIQYIPPANVTVSTFTTTANGSANTYDLGFNPLAPESILVTIDGVVQPDSSYSVNTSSNTITFVTNPGNGEDVRVVSFYTTANAFIIPDNSITGNKFSASANATISTLAENSALALAIALG